MPFPRNYRSFLSIFEFVNVTASQSAVALQLTTVWLVFLLAQIDFMRFSSAGCVFKVTFYSSWAMMMLLPLVLVAAYSLFYLLPSWLAAARLPTAEDRDAARTRARLVWLKLVLFTLLVLFPRVSSACLRLFKCTAVEGTSYLTADFHIVCFDATWNAVAGVNALALLLYPIGIPALFLVLVFRARKAGQFHEPQTKYSIGFLFEVGPSVCCLLAPSHSLRHCRRTRRIAGGSNWRICSTNW